MEGFDHANLGQRATASENHGEFIQAVNLSIAKGTKVGSCHDGVGLEGNVLVENTDFVCNGCRSLDVVASNHMNSNTSGAALFNSASSFRARGVIETSQTDKLKLSLDLGTIMAILSVTIHRLGCDTEHSQTLAGEFFSFSEDFLLELFSLIELGKEDLDCALGVDVSSLFYLITINNAHEFTGGIERMLGHQGVTPGNTTAESHSEDLQSNLCRLTNGLPLSIFGSDDAARVRLGLFLAVTDCGIVAKSKNLEESVQAASGQVRRPLDSSAVRVVGVGGALNSSGEIATEPNLSGNHSSLSQGTSLVRADVGNTANGFKGRHLTNNDIAANHCLGGNGHCNSQNCEERLGDNSHTDADTVQKDLIGDLPQTGGKDDDDEDNGEGEKQQGELAEGDLERGSLEAKDSATELVELPNCATDGSPFGVVVLILAQEFGNLADLCFHTSSNDNTGGSTSSDRASGVGQVNTITHGHVGVGEYGIWLLADGDRFTSEKCLIGRDVDTLNQAQIGRNNIASCERD